MLFREFYREIKCRETERETERERKTRRILHHRASANAWCAGAEREKIDLVRKKIIIG